MSLLPNPSHLELVDPVVVGKTKAKQTFTAGATKQTTMVREKEQPGCKTEPCD